jgi:hypothetical protein
LNSIHSGYLCVFSSDTVNFFLPLALRAANTLRPFADAILSRKPCLFFLFLTDGWNVRNDIFLMIYVRLRQTIIIAVFLIRTAKIELFSFLQIFPGKK